MPSALAMRFAANTTTILHQFTRRFAVVGVDVKSLVELDVGEVEVVMVGTVDVFVEFVTFVVVD